MQVRGDVAKRMFINAKFKNRRALERHKSKQTAAASHAKPTFALPCSSPHSCQLQLQHCQSNRRAPHRPSGGGGSQISHASCRHSAPQSVKLTNKRTKAARHDRPAQCASCRPWSLLSFVLLISTRKNNFPDLSRCRYALWQIPNQTRLLPVLLHVLSRICRLSPRHHQDQPSSNSVRHSLQNCRPSSCPQNPASSYHLLQQPSPCPPQNQSQNHSLTHLLHRPSASTLPLALCQCAAVALLKRQRGRGATTQRRKTAAADLVSKSPFCEVQPQSWDRLYHHQQQRCCCSQQRRRSAKKRQVSCDWRRSLRMSPKCCGLAAAV